MLLVTVTGVCVAARREIAASRTIAHTVVMPILASSVLFLASGACESGRRESIGRQGRTRRSSAEFPRGVELWWRRTGECCRGRLRG